MTTPEILRQAAVEIRKGWTQFILVDAAGGVCANGAILSAVRGQRLAALHDAFGLGSERNIAFYHASDALARVLHLPRFGIPTWNNAADQTAENVAATMELAAICFEQAHATPETLAAVDPKVQVLESVTTRA